MKLIAITAAQREADAIGQDDEPLAAVERLELADPLDVDDAGAMDAEEDGGIEAALHGGHRSADGMTIAPDVQRHVVAAGLHPVNLVRAHEDDSAMHLDRDTVESRRRHGWLDGSGGRTVRSWSSKAGAFAARRGQTSSRARWTRYARLMRLAELVSMSNGVAGVSGRLDKLDRLATLLARLEPEEIPVAVAFLSGATRQGRIGLGASGIRQAAAAEPADAPTLTLLDVDRAFDAMSTVSGRGAAGERVRLLHEMFARDGRGAGVPRAAPLR